MTSKDSLQAAVSFIEGKTPFVNALIANSGALGSVTSEPKRDPNSSVANIQKQFWDTTMEQSAIALNVNVLGSFYTFVAFMRLLEEGNLHPESRGKKDFIQSQFITTTSLAAFSRMENVGYPYMASKAGLVHLTKSLATQFAKVGIRANSISPGLYVTEMTEVCVALFRPSCCVLTTCLVCYWR